MNAPASTVVVGAGLAGARCAETLRAEGYDGELVLVGEEPVPPYERPALSKEFLAGRRDADDLLLRPESFWAEQRIELVLGERVTEIDHDRRTATTRSGRELRWEAIVLATGARPRRLPFPAPEGVHVLRTLADAVALREELVPGARLTIVGGGFVGAEVASTARSLGVDVTLLEAGALPFAHALGRELGARLAERYRDHGVDIRTEAVASAFETTSDGRVTGVVLGDGSVVASDAVLTAVGVEPAHELGHVVEPPLYACGDNAGSRGHWTGAAAEAVEVARRLLGLDPLPKQPPFFWSDQFGLRLQLVGDTTDATAVEVEGSQDSFVARYHARGGKLVAALASNRPTEVGRLRVEVAAAA
jgi:3-phenylpropionate/trans-cinnamate dioxygenase ferredoxin reductase component